MCKNLVLSTIATNFRKEIGRQKPQIKKNNIYLQKPNLLPTKCTNVVYKSQKDSYFGV